MIPMKYIPSSFKITSLLLIFLLSANYALSQSKTFTVKGKVYEAHTQIQLLECHVEILSATDSSVIDSTIAIQKFRSGNDTFYTSEYSMSIPKEEGEYIVRVSNTNSVRYAVSDSGDMRSLVFQVFLRLQS